MELTKHFTLEEFTKSDKAIELGINNTPNDEEMENIKFVAEQLELIRNTYKQPINITSGYRCEELNNAVGGVPNSYHRKGLAVDIKAESSNTFKGTKENKWLIENAYKYGFILRYTDDTEDITGVKYESWHYRYVGTQIASYLNEHDMTYDEYYIRFLDRR